MSTTTGSGRGFNPTLEAFFQSWFRKHAAAAGLSQDPDEPEHEYDYRHAFLAGAEPGADQHWPSAYKTDSHPNRYIEEDNLWDSKTEMPFGAIPARRPSSRPTTAFPGKRSARSSAVIPGAR